MADPDKSWWTTLPGLLTALAGIITAVGGLIAVLVQAGLIGNRSAPAGAQTQGSAGAESARTAPAGASAAAADAAPPKAVDVAAAPVVVADAPPSAANADAAAGAMHRAVLVTSKGGSRVALKPGAEILGDRLPLQDGQEVGFDRLLSIDITQPWDGTLALTLRDGRRLEVRAANTTLSGVSELGKYLSSLSEIRRIEFVRDGSQAAPVAATAQPFTALRVTGKGGKRVELRPTAEILGAALPLKDGREVGFEHLSSVEIVQPWDGSLRLVLVDGRRLDAMAANTTLSGSSELGPYLASLSDLRRIEFIR
ncbi:hypothetical protein [Rivibacter subsaxonicus]|uniref:Uncharacterized protein n=1 Tax=Rivibacter subsaxonicus TaxID=457575 RepID=A0A4Q7VCP0_9BURK|nr:hypothetical protein [Rivibacter subsaxonicus]RZT93624.1 hypothetical protein EV670_3174 [Rivibacter subsaxonicus]